MNTIKNIVLVGEENQVLYFTARALDFYGFPTTKSAAKVSKLSLLKNWTLLKFALKNRLLFKNINTISIRFPKEPPAAYTESLKGIYWAIVDVPMEG
jgi:hypothetical protein